MAGSLVHAGRKDDFHIEQVKDAKAARSKIETLIQDAEKLSKQWPSIMSHLNDIDEVIRTGKAEVSELKQAKDRLGATINGIDALIDER